MTTTTTRIDWRAVDSDHRRRFEATLAGDAPDGTLATSAWQHFPGLEYDTEALSSAIAAQVLKHDFGWLKINPRGIYYGEVWGAVYDDSDYGGGEVPRLVSPAWTSLDDLAGVVALPDSPVLAEQVELQAQLRRLLPDRPLVYTVFSPLSVLLQGLGLPLYVGHPAFGPTPTLRIDELWGADPTLLHSALAAITDTLVEFVGRLRDAGADGIFYAVTGTANPALSADEGWFAEFSTPYDQRVLHAAAGGVRMLHTCGPHSHPERFVNWPVEVLHWDSFAAGNPGLADLPGVVAGGVDHRIFNGEHDDEIAAQTDAARAAFRDRRFLLAPTCTVVSGGLNDGSLDLLAAASRANRDGR